MVDLPLPVGPEVKIMPFGLFMPFLIALSERPAKPILSRSNVFPDLSSSLMTTCSPQTTGLMAIRKSTSLFATLTANCPSWGMRCSSIFKFDKILIRLTKEGSMLFGNCIISLKTPSTLVLIFKLFSRGSM